MISRFFFSLGTIAALATCDAPYKKSDEADKKPLKYQAKDQAFQAFVGRLKTAVAKKDRPMLANMMTQDFGYRWDDAPQGEVIFDYWDRNKLWTELSRVLQKGFEAHDLYMVAPPEVVTDPNYSGYRAGIRIVGGSWRFAYFVPAEPEQAAAPAPLHGEADVVMPR